MNELNWKIPMKPIYHLFEFKCVPILKINFRKSDSLQASAVQFLECANDYLREIRADLMIWSGQTHFRMKLIAKMEFANNGEKANVNLWSWHVL